MNDFFYLIAKTWIGGLILHWFFAYFSFLIPSEKLIETDAILAFHHPAPSYSLHIVIVPKAGLRSLAELPTNDLSFESDLFQAVTRLVKDFNLKTCGYRLIANGGGNQEVDHLHFHLVSDDYQVELTQEPYQDTGNDLGES